MIKSSIFIHIVIVILLGLTSCDSSDGIPIQPVDSHDRLNDAELRQLEARSREQKQAHNQQQSQNHIFYFGFDLRSSPQEDAAQYIPFLNYLEATTGYRFKLHFTPKNSSTAHELGKGIIQFAAMGATSYLKAHEQYGAISLVRGINHQGAAQYRSVFVVKPNSRIRNINDIKGSKLAFGSPDSTQGHLIPRIMLLENNIPLNDLAAYNFTGSHQNCAEGVVSGKYDVCGMQDQLAEKLAAQGTLKIIHYSRYYPSSGIVVSPSVQPDVIARIKLAMLDFKPQGKDQQKLYNWEDTEMPKGFIAAEDSDYTDLRHWSIKMGLLKETPRPEH